MNENSLLSSESTISTNGEIISKGYSPINMFYKSVFKYYHSQIIIYYGLLFKNL